MSLIGEFWEEEYEAMVGQKDKIIEDLRKEIAALRKRLGEQTVHDDDY